MNKDSLPGRFPFRSVSRVRLGMVGLFLLGLPTVALAVDPPVAEPQAVAIALQNTFIGISDTVGPATVRLLSILPAPAENPAAGETPSFGAGVFPDVAPRRGRALGSGVLIRPEGYILTNDHVVEDSPGNRIMVTLSDGSTYTGIVFRDRMSDLAVVKIDAGHPLPYAKIADSDKLRVGQWAIAIGSPFDQQNTMTTGIVSALHRNRQIPDGREGRYYADLIQTDAAINMGNSGGPLLNVDGELIGINVAILSPSGTSAGIGFAIPANTARIVADQLISKGKVTHSNLGIVPQDIPAFLRTRLGAEHGAYVNQVREGTPAFRAGLQAGDVITRFGTTEIVGEVGLRNAISLATPNVVVPITIVRAGKAHALSATLVPRESVETGAAAAPVATAAIPHRRAVEFGILLRPLTPTLATDLHLPAGTKGVFVGNVVQGSSAADAGLERDCVVTAVNGVAVADADGVNHLLSQTKPGDIVTLTLYLPAIDEISAGHGVVDILVP